MELSKETLALKEKYNLQPHPEGGYFAETFRSKENVTTSKGLTRSSSTAILFMITPDKVSRFHRLQSDEVWHFYDGGPMTVVELTNDSFKTTVLGRDEGSKLQHVVPAGTWFGSFPNEGTEFSLVGCTVSPGFDFDDFELASRQNLLCEYPKAKEIIEKLTKGLP
eukprot:g330.t1